MNEPKDKRTKEWKQWKANFDNRPKGLGDTIEKITEATGIKKAVQFIAGEDCGCDDRKKKLNKLYRYNRTNCPTEAHFNFMRDFFSTRKTRVQKEEQEMIVQILNHTFNKNLKPTRCGSCVKGWVNELKKLYDTYL